MTKVKAGLATVLTLVFALSLSSCSGSKLEVSDVTAIIDIRTAAEFEKSHIVGAVNIDYSLNDFGATVIEYSSSGKYYLYASTEEEAAKAVGDMIGIGYKRVTNLGSFEDAQRVLPLGVTN